MNRRESLKVLAGLMATPLPLVLGQNAPADPKRILTVSSFELDELGIPELQDKMRTGETSSLGLAKRYLARIEEIDQQGPSLNAVIETNPDALAIARTLDAERKAKGPRSLLHGIPILVKDNLDTGDRMRTSAGSLALANWFATEDSFVVQKLRAAGALILGKTNLSEWANFRSSRSTSGWSARGGQTRNPYRLNRNPSGSSSGSGVAVSANLCAAAIGTETDGSILSPSSCNGIVGLKPTVGLISRSGIVPISHSQDTAGPMTRTVTDAAILLNALAGVDPRDNATAASVGKVPPDYTAFLDRNGLKGARIGVARKFFRSRDPGAKLAQNALEEMKRLGAILIDPADLPSHGKNEGAEFATLLYEFKANLNAYLVRVSRDLPAHSLEELIDFNEKNKATEMAYFGQELFLQAQAKGPLSEAAYLAAREKCLRLSRTEGIDAIMDQDQLDALVAPTTGPAQVTDFLYGDRDTGGSTSAAAIAGYPSITVPIGLVSELPVGISFFGRAFSEGALLKLAFAFEQGTRARRPPSFLT